MEETVIRMVGNKLVCEVPLAQVLEDVAGRGKLTFEITSAQIIQAVHDAGVKAPVAQPGGKPGPSPSALSRRSSSVQSARQPPGPAMGNGRHLFPLGRLAGTPGALRAFARTGETPINYVLRHWRLDPGVLSAEDQEANRRAAEHGGRILSAYLLRDGTRIWIITEADRSMTTVLLPDEY